MCDSLPGSSRGSRGVRRASLIATFLFCGGIASAWAQTINYRSIGTAAGALYNTGTASIALGTTTVDFTGTCLPLHVGQGDRLILDPGGPNQEELYILSRNTRRQVTVQTAATLGHLDVSFQIERAYNTLQSWEDAIQGDLVSENRREVGVAYDEGPFTIAGSELLRIDGSTTDATRYIHLTAASGRWHKGVPGAGVVLDGQGTTKFGILIIDDFTRIHRLELVRFHQDSALGGGGSSAILIGAANNVLIEQVLVHEFENSTIAAYGIRGSSTDPSSSTVRNCIVYDGDAGGIFLNHASSSMTVENCTVYGMDERGVHLQDGSMVVTNTISMDSPLEDFFDNAGGMTQSHNLSSDGTASGTGSLVNQAAADQFVSIVSGSERFLLKEGADAIDAGTDLSGSFTADVGGSTRFTGAAWDIGADEKMVVNYRSIGTNGGVLYNTGTASVSAGSVTVTLGGGASLPSPTAVGAAGVGDVLVLNPGQPNEESAHILSRDSATQVTLQSAAVSIHSGEPYEIRRAYTSLQDWEVARRGDLVGEDRREVGVAYKDGLFTGASPVLIFNSATVADAAHFMWLTVAEGQRHDGTAGTGVVIDGGSGTHSRAIEIKADHTVVEWLEMRGFYGASGGGNVLVEGRDVRLQQLLIHDFFDSANAVRGVRSAGTDIVRFTVRNCAIYDGGDGILLDVCGSTATIENTTLFNMRRSPGRGIQLANGESMTVTNTIVMDSTTNDFVDGVGTMVQSYNISSDATAAGTGSLINKVAADQFLDVNLGTENLHLKAGADAIDAGTDLSALFSQDIDGESRLGSTWDIGADELGGTTAVDLVSFEARGLDGEVELSWETGSELDHLGFHLFRSVREEGPYERITSRLIPGLGSAPQGAFYRYRDTGVANEVTYYYQLEDVDLSGAAERHGPIAATPRTGARPPERATPDPDASLIAYGEPETSALRFLERTGDRIVLELRTGGFYAETQADGTVRLSIPGFEQEQTLPLKRSWVEVTAGKKVRLVSVRPSAVEAVRGLAPSRFVPVIEASRTGVARAALGSPRRGEDAPGWAQLAETAFQGEVKKTRLEMFPLQWEASRGQLLFARRLEIVLALGGREESERAGSATRGRRHREPASHQRRAALSQHLLTRRSGVYALSFEEAFGRRSRPIEASLLRLSRRGESVPYYLEPRSSFFGPGSMLYFVGEADGVYTLERGGLPGERMAELVAPPSGEMLSTYWSLVEREENRLYQAGLLEAADVWLWDAVFAPDRKTYTFEIAGLAPSGEPSRIAIDLQGGSLTTHHLRAYLNGVFLGATIWDGKLPHRIEADVAAGVLQEGTNALELELLAGNESPPSMILLDRFELLYPRIATAESGNLEGEWSRSGVALVTGLPGGAFVLDVTSAPAWLSPVEPSGDGVRFRVEAGRRYLVTERAALLRPVLREVPPARLRDAGRGADYLAIGPREFLEAAEPLFALRRSEGLRVETASVEEIASEFGDGEASPQALRDFISFAYHHWEAPSLRYVFLLGDATYDPKDYLGTGAPNHVPTPVVRTSYLWTASDPLYASVNGEDLLPDLAIGRIPASHLDQLRSVVQKLVAYQVYDGPAVLVADNPDRAGDFTRDARELAESVLASRNPETILLETLGRAATRAAIHDAFARGASLLSYLGHGGIHLWADENLLDIGDVASLPPQARQPLVLTLNCLNGYFHFPYFDALAEALLVTPEKGAIAVFSPSGLSLNGPAHRYHRALLEQILSGEHARLGDAVLAAQSVYADSGALPELLAIYHLFGDPALPITR